MGSRPRHFVLILDLSQQRTNKGHNINNNLFSSSEFAETGKNYILEEECWKDNVYWILIKIEKHPKVQADKQSTYKNWHQNTIPVFHHSNSSRNELWGTSYRRWREQRKRRVAIATNPPGNRWSIVRIPVPGLSHEGASSSGLGILHERTIQYQRSGLSSLICICQDGGHKTNKKEMKCYTNVERQYHINLMLEHHIQKREHGKASQSL